MAETTPVTGLKAILETIRERADYALKQLQDAEEQRSMRWQCKSRTNGARQNYTVFLARRSRAIFETWSQSRAGMV